jgi:SAM-dependent methyltransferase
MRSLKFKKSCTVCIAGAVLLFGLVVYLQHGKWDKYYKNKMGLPPRPIVADALHLFQNQGKAIDLGCGVGNEAVFLLNHGWTVWAIDSEDKAIQLIKQRTDIKDSKQIISAVAKFEDESTWNTLPIVDFIYASYALPFCKQMEFKKVWSHIKEHISPKGRFAGHFFGLNYQGFTTQEMKGMTFFKREEVIELFQDFEIAHFKETEQDGFSGTGRPIHSHVFEVIAHKK